MDKEGVIANTQKSFNFFIAGQLSKTLLKQEEWVLRVFLNKVGSTHLLKVTVLKTLIPLCLMTSHMLNSNSHRN